MESRAHYLQAGSYQREAKSCTYKISDWEMEKIWSISAQAQERFNNVDDRGFSKEQHLYTAQLPLPLRQFLLGFKNSFCDFALIRGIKINNERLGLTPEHWSEEKANYVKQLQFINYFIAATLGHTFGWQTQQNGSMISDVLPIKGFETKQQGFGSISGLRFHTEDPFHVGRADYFTLMSMRNHEKIPTTVFPMDLSEIPESIKDELFRAQFSIIPDESHTDLTYDENIGKQQKVAFSKFNQVKKIPILYGKRSNPFLRVDPEIMDNTGLSIKAQEAFDFIISAIESCRQEIILEQGNMIAINNHRLAHGRGAFSAKYNGQDRWIERILVVEDLRKSIEYRSSEFDAVIRE